MARKLVVEVIGDSRSYEKALLRSAKAGDKFGGSLRRTGLAVTAMVATMAGLGAAAVRSSSRFEESMQKIVGLSGVAQGKIEGLSDAVLKLAPEVGKGPQELAEALLFITSSGVPASRAMDALTVSAKASAAGLGETKTVADAVTSVMNAYGQANVSAKQATDVLVATVREGKGEATEFAGVIGNVVSIASQLGVSFNDVGAALAAMTRLGTDAETSATQLQQVFSNLVKVSPQQAKAFAKVGLSAEGLRKTLSEKGLLAGLKEIKTAFAGDLPGLAKAFGDIRALRGVLALVGNQAAATAGIFDRMRDSSEALGIAFDAVSRTTAQQFRKLKAAAQVVGIQIGAAFAPLAVVVARGLTAATREVSAFIERLGEADSFSAKIDVIVESGRDVVANIQEALGRAVGAIDWDAVWSKARGIADGLQERLEQTDFSAVGRRIGDAFADAVEDAIPAVKELADRITEAVRTIQWEDIGKAMGPGLAAAVVTAFVTLMDPSFWVRNWDLTLALALAVFGKGIGKIAGAIGGLFVSAVAGALARVSPALGAAFRGLAIQSVRAFGVIGQLVLRALAPLTGLIGRVFARLGRIARFTVKVLGIQVAINAIVGFAKQIGGMFERVGRDIVGGIGRGIDSAKDAVIRKLLEFVNQLLGVTAFLGRFDPFKGLREKVQARLEAMEQDAASGFGGIGASAEKAAKRVQKAVDIIRASVKQLAGLTAKPQPTGFMDALLGSPTPTGAGGGDGGVAPPKPKPDTTGPPKWIERWRKAADALQLAVDQASLALDKAGGTPALRDDITAMEGIVVALGAQEKAIRAQLALHPKNLDLQRQLLDVQRAQVGQEQALANAVKQRAANQKAAAKQATQAAQFKALGLDAAGGALAPTAKNLRARLGNITDAVKGTFLDTGKTRSLLERIRKVLSGAFGKISSETRATIKGMLDDIVGQFDDTAKGPLTKTSGLNTKKIIEGLGLDADTAAQIRSRLSGFNTAGRALAAPTSSTLRPAAALGAGAGLGTIQVDVILDGEKVGRAVTRVQQKDRRRNPRQKRGPNRIGA